MVSGIIPHCVTAPRSHQFQWNEGSWTPQNYHAALDRVVLSVQSIQRGIINNQDIVGRVLYLAIWPTQTNSTVFHSLLWYLPWHALAQLIVQKSISCHFLRDNIGLFYEVLPSFLSLASCSVVYFSIINNFHLTLIALISSIE